MSNGIDNLFAAAESYLNNTLEFDVLYGLAVEQLPESREEDAHSPTARLAALIAAMEAESHEFTEAENRARLREFLATHTAARRT